MGKAREWPADGSPVKFDFIAEPVVKAMRHCYRMKRRNKDSDAPWSGLPLGRREQASCLNPKEALTAKSLAYVKEDQFRSAVEVIIGVAIQLGIEQGRRMEAQRREEGPDGE